MNPTSNYLRDMMSLLIERTKEARIQRDHLAGGVDKLQSAFESGRATAYYEVVATLVGHLEDFGLTKEGVGLREDFDPDRLL